MVSLGRVYANKKMNISLCYHAEVSLCSGGFIIVGLLQSNESIGRQLEIAVANFNTL